MKNLFATHYYDTSKLKHSNQLEGLELASFTRRLSAFLLDIITLLIFLYVVGIILDFFGVINFGLQLGVSPNNTADPIPQIHNSAHIEAPEYLKFLLKLLIPILYFGIITWLTNGYTLGKFLFKIRIISTNHRRLNLWHAIERSIGYYASSLEFGFGFLQFFIDYNRRTVHDRIAETIVINVKKSNM